MNRRSTPDSTRTGLLRPRDHCTFTWTQAEDAEIRTVEVRPDHCLQCIAELRRRGHRLISSDGNELP
jgi:hypothetical protein